MGVEVLVAMFTPGPPEKIYVVVEEKQRGMNNSEGGLCDLGGITEKARDG